MALSIRENKLSWKYQTLCCLLTGIGYFIAFPGIFELWPLAFVALIPIYLVLRYTPNDTRSIEVDGIETRH